MEPMIVQAFAAKFGLQLAWLDAKYTWGKYVKETQRYTSECLCFYQGILI